MIDLFILKNIEYVEYDKICIKQKLKVNTKLVKQPRASTLPRACFSPRMILWFGVCGIKYFARSTKGRAH